MRYDTHVPEATVTVNGSEIPGMADNRTRLVVETQRNLPAMCEVEYHDPDSQLMMVDNPLLRPGAALKVTTASASEDPTTVSPFPLFDGEVVAIEVVFTPELGRRMVLRGYDKSHRLHRSKATKTWLNQTDSTIATSIAGNVGMTPRVDPTAGLHPYLLQNNQTDWEFLQQRARENGFEVGVANGMLVFAKAGGDLLAGITHRLDLGDNLLSFRVRATSAEQPRTTTVTAFNPVTKLAVQGTAPPPRSGTTVADPQLQAATIGLHFGATEQARTDLPLDLPTAAIGHAAARRNHTSEVAVEAEGRCHGNPAMRARGKVEVGRVGTSLAGTYVLSRVRHTIGKGGYQTDFTVSGLHDRSLLGLTRPGAATRAGHADDTPDRQLAPALGLVTNSNDPLNLGRVKVKLPWLPGDVESTWAAVVYPGAGASRGLQLVPEVNDTVLVVFEHGDLRRPYVLGGLYTSKDRPAAGPVPSPVANGTTNLRVLKTRAGHTLTFDDTASQEKVTLVTKGGATIELEDATDRINVATSGGPSVELVGGPRPTITATCGTSRIELDHQGSITIKAGGNVAIESTANMDLKATGRLTLEGTGGVTIKSPATTQVEGTATTVKANAMLTLQGALTKIN